MDIRSLSRADIEAYVHRLEKQLGKKPTDVSEMSFFDIEDLITELECEVAFQ